MPYNPMDIVNALCRLVETLQAFPLGSMFLLLLGGVVVAGIAAFRRPQR